MKRYVQARGKLYDEEIVMDRAALLELLKQTERDVAEAEQRLVHQLAVISALEKKGNDSEEAIRLLEQLRAIHGEHVVYRERLLKALANSPAQ